jgi:hypothetical protein
VLWIVALAALIAVVAALLSFPARAAPPAQGGPVLPTPTMFPVETVDYTLTIVGGKDELKTFAHENKDGFTFTETTARSVYPGGMIFTVGVESAAGEIVNAQWVLKRERFIQGAPPAERDEVSGQWVARPWQDGGQPVGLEGEFFWRVTDAAGNVAETDPQYVVYWDPEHVWFRMESDIAILYWTGFGQENPDAVARGMAEYLAGIYPRWVAGFGRGLSYKPLAMVYPTQESFAARMLTGILDPALAGVTSPGDGLTVQRLTEAPPLGAVYQCIWINAEELRPLEPRLLEMYATIAHEFTHLYQGDVLGTTRGPLWWSEGEAEWFSGGMPGYAEARMSHLSLLQDIPSLQGELRYQQREDDGCNRLAYDAGASFINWLLTTYGGIDTHLKIVELLYNNVSLFDAIAQVTGKPFLEIENEWRAYHGFRPILAEELDPALGLEPYEDPVLKVGDTITLPAVPAISMISEDPVPNSLAVGSCWANMQVTILAMGQKDDVAYFQVDCMGQQGWMTRDQLIPPE